jgi:hypothetical protein
VTMRLLTSSKPQFCKEVVISTAVITRSSGSSSGFRSYRISMNRQIEWMGNYIHWNKVRLYHLWRGAEATWKKKQIEGNNNMKRTGRENWSGNQKGEMKNLRCLKGCGIGNPWRIT